LQSLSLKNEDTGISTAHAILQRKWDSN